MPTPVKIHGVVVSLVAHGRSTYTILVKPDRRLPIFRPGQFAHIAIDSYDPSQHWPDSRVFSIASSPARRDLIRFTYTVKGAFTSRMERFLEIGSRIWLKLPYGDFTFDHTTYTDREVALIAGGTGFTPYASYLEYVLGGFASPIIRILYGASEPNLLIYRPLITQVCQKLNNCRAILFSESGASEDIQPGRMKLDSLLDKIDRPLNTDYYLSGPKEMIDSFMGQLLGKSIHPDQIRVDKWE